MVNLSLEVLEKVKHNGRLYKKVKGFSGEREAEVFAKNLEKTVCKSRRFPPLIRKVRIGLRLGNRYQVFVPDNLEVK